MIQAEPVVSLASALLKGGAELHFKPPVLSLKFTTGHQHAQMLCNAFKILHGHDSLISLGGLSEKSAHLSYPLLIQQEHSASCLWLSRIPYQQLVGFVGAVMSPGGSSSAVDLPLG